MEFLQRVYEDLKSPGQKISQTGMIPVISPSWEINNIGIRYPSGSS